MTSRARGPGVRVLAAALLGLSLGATLLSWFVASSNFRVSDPAHDPRLDQVFSALEGGEARRLALRYVTNESNRALFLFLGPTQLAVSALATGLGVLAAGRAGSRRRGLLLVLASMLAASVATALLVDPIVELGREIDFLSREPQAPDAVARFGRLHGFYMLADLVKVVMALGALGLLLFPAKPEAPKPTA